MTNAGAKLKKFLDKKGIVKTKLAADLGMSPQNLYQFFKSQELEKDTIRKIEKALHVKWADIDAINIDSEQVDIFTAKTPEPTTVDKLADSNHMLADSVHRMVLMLEEKEKTLGEIKSSLAQMPADMIALTAKLLEGQQGLRKELQHVSSHLSKDRSKTPSRQ